MTQTGAGDKRRIDSLDDIEPELAAIALQGLIPTVAASILGATPTAGLLAWQYRDPWLTALAAVNLVVSAMRLSIVLRASPRKLAQLGTGKLRRLYYRYGMATAAYCCCIALVVVRLARIHSVQGLCLSLVGVFSISIGLASRIGMRPWITQIGGGVLLAAAGYAMLASELSLKWIGAVAIAFFAYQFFYTLDNQFSILVEQLRTRRQLRILSEQDTLTGLSNRRHFESALDALCTSGQLFAILFIDLDRFKQVNDRFGHAAGDALLVEVADRLRAVIRSTDLLARLGGDEFAILQTPLLSRDTSDAGDSVKAFAARINTAVSEPFHIGAHRISIGASIGIRLSDTGQTDANTLLGKADQALYLVKQAGGGSFSLAPA